jgi:hypothetical protein
MKQKRDDADSELEQPFDFSNARPNPYVDRAKRARRRFHEVTDEQDAARQTPRRGRASTKGR